MDDLNPSDWEIRIENLTNYKLKWQKKENI